MAAAAAAAASAALAAARLPFLLSWVWKPSASPPGWATLELGSECTGALVPAPATGGELLVCACALGTAADCGVWAAPTLRLVRLTLEPLPLLCRRGRPPVSPACGACGVRTAWRGGASVATAAAYVAAPCAAWGALLGRCF